MDTYAFCGAQGPASSMDLTGHGLRCTHCTARSELEAFRGDRNEMAEHLTRFELEAVAASGGRQVLAGVGLAVGGLVLTVFSIAAGGLIMIAFTGMMLAGLGLVRHGLHRRDTARDAIAEMPDARVV